MYKKHKVVKLLFYSIMIKPAWGATLHCYLLALGPWENYFNPWCLRFFVCKMVITVIIQSC